MSAPTGFVELQDAAPSSAELAPAASSPRPSAADGSAPRPTKPRTRASCASIPPLARPLAGACAFGLACVLLAALSPEDSLAHVLVLQCWTLWAWTNVLLVPVWLVHLGRVLGAGLRATARCGLARRDAAPRGPLLGWVPVGDVAVLLLAWLALGCASTWAWSSRALPAGFFQRQVAPSDLVFPRGFSWGAATAAYQVEGGLNNTQWYRFEQTFTHADGSAAIADGWQCGLAADSWNRFDEDLGCMVALGIKTYRFSVEWSRVEPTRGSFDDAAMARYVSWAERLRAKGIEPLVTLHHFTDPLWRTDLGGLQNASMADDFERYVRYVGAALGPTVDYWVTVNEIMVVAAVGYLNGQFPPGETGDLLGMLRAVRTMVEMHRAAYRALHDVDRLAAPGGQGRACLVSVAQNVVFWKPANSWAPTEALLAGIMEGYYNRFVLEELLRARPERGGPLGPRGSGLDYLGLNHYFSQVVSYGGLKVGFDGRYALSDMDWTLDPGSLYEVVLQYSRWAPGLPIVITEHGCADAQAPDARRVEFLRKSLLGLRAAITDARVPVIGYVHWALIDKCARPTRSLPCRAPTPALPPTSRRARCPRPSRARRARAASSGPAATRRGSGSSASTGPAIWRAAGRRAAAYTGRSSPRMRRPAR